MGEGIVNFKTMKHIYFILIAILVFTSTNAQNKPEERPHYLFPEFTQGVVLMKSGVENETSLNYNSLTEEMIFDKKGRKLAMAETDLALTDTVFIKDRKFIVLNGGFVELLYHSTCHLYAEHKGKLKEPGKPAGYGGTSETSSISSHSSLRMGGLLYELKLPDGYKVKPYTVLWLEKKGALNKFVNMTQLKKLYKGKNDLFKTYVKKHGVKYRDQESIVQLIEYLESN
jgi:hypothetical protein